MKKLATQHAYQHDTGPLREILHCSADKVWIIDLGRRGVGACSFCPQRAQSMARRSAQFALPQDIIQSLERSLKLLSPKKPSDWVWVSPYTDPFVKDAADLAKPAIQAARWALRRGLGVTLRTRGDLSLGSTLVELAREFPGKLRVEIGFFSVQRDLMSTWERGVGTLEGRLTLAKSLARAGADVAAIIGPLIPMTNEGQRDLDELGRRLERAGLTTWIPTWITYAPELIQQIQLDISRSQARMIQGWLQMKRTGRRSTPQIPENIKRRILSRLHESADSRGAQLIVCRCTSSLGRGRCIQGPRLRQNAITQLDLFAVGEAS